MILEIHPDNPQQRKIDEILAVLSRGGVIIYPTDSVYAVGCDMNNQKAVEKVCALRNLDPSKAMLTFLCNDISQLSLYSGIIPNETFKLIKKNTPGPVTFILESNNKVPRLFKNKKRTIGARIPDHTLIREVVSQLGRPILSSSLKQTGETDLDYFNGIDEIIDQFGTKVDLIIDSGTVPNEPTAVISCLGGIFEVYREGTKEISY